MFLPCLRCISQAWTIGRQTFLFYGVWTQGNGTYTQRYSRISVFLIGNTRCGPSGPQVWQLSQQVCLHIQGTSSGSSGGSVGSLHPALCLLITITSSSSASHNWHGWHSYDPYCPGQAKVNVVCWPCMTSGRRSVGFSRSSISFVARTHLPSFFTVPGLNSMVVETRFWEINCWFRPNCRKEDLFRRGTRRVEALGLTVSEVCLSHQMTEIVGSVQKIVHLV